MTEAHASRQVTNADAAALLKRCAAEGVDQIELQFADITGAVKSVFVPSRGLEAVLRDGAWFDGSAIEGVAREVESDMYLRPDPATFGLLEPTGGLTCARLLCDVVEPDGQPYAGDSRSTLRAILEQALDGGLEYAVAPEVEFFLLPAADGSAPLEDDPSSYFERSRGRSRTVELEIVGRLEKMGVQIESSHHEVASGQFELDLPLQPALAAADALTTLKPAVKELAHERDLEATFMPKPFYGAAGSGMHTHQVCFRDGSNAFHDPVDPYGLSPIGRRFAAGQLEHAPGMCALLAPLVNSYKRLVPGYEAPIAGSWGRHNRSALIRVPALGASGAGAGPAAGGRTAGGRAPDGHGTRLELRLPDPSCNPYLAFAAMLAAGLDGLDRELELGPPMEELEHDYGAGGGRRTARPLPGSLGEALTALDADDMLTDALGSTVLDLFKAAKRLEWVRYRSQVTPWEIENYRRRY